MSKLSVDKLESKSGGPIRIASPIVFEYPMPGLNYGPVNDIGIAGTQGFGVGIAPVLPTGFSALSGTYDPASPNYGNYQYSDGSIMVWMPAFFYKYGTGSNGLAVNAVDIKPLSAYASVAAANSAGYALHRAFYDGGQIKQGFFIDKYECSNNGGIASSIRNGNPLSSHSTHNPFSGLNGAPANNYGGAFAAAKTRGAGFFCKTRYMRAALALLSLAHGQAATGTAFCAWYLSGANFPKGNNNNALGDINDTLLAFQSDGFPNAAKCGSGSHFAKTTHNGQDCGVADLNGNMWEIELGMTYGAGTGGTGYHVLKTSVAAKDLTGGNTLATDAFGTAGIDANYDFAGASFGYASETGGVRAHRFGNGANQALAEAASGLNWQMAGLGLPLATGASSAGTTLFGHDYMSDKGPASAELCLISGCSWSHGSLAGAWALYLNDVRGNSGPNVGFRSACYV